MYIELINPDFIMFFNINFILAHNPIATVTMIKIGKIIPSKKIKCMFWEYIKSTGNKAIKIGWNTSCFFKLFHLTSKYGVYLLFKVLISKNRISETTQRFASKWMMIEKVVYSSIFTRNFFQYINSSSRF